MMKQIAFKLELFEGPLDLLLHLIGKNKVSIYDIPISEITEQYMEYLETMKQFDIELSSEFLVLAAHLLYIKSRMLLPKAEEEEAQEDPRSELAQRLAQYQRMKCAAADLSQMEREASCLYYKTQEQIEPLLIDESLKLVTLQHLQDAMADVFEKLARRNPPSAQTFSRIVGRKPVAVLSKVKQFLSRLKQFGAVPFSALFRGVQTRDEAVASFLAVLELAKMNRVRIIEQKGGVQLRYLNGEGGDAFEQPDDFVNY